MTEPILRMFQVSFELKDIGVYEILAESEEHAMIIGEHLCRNFEPFHKLDKRSRNFMHVKPLYKEAH